MDLFKKQNSKKATNWNWDVPQKYIKEDIKSILTKEMFEAIVYKLEE